MDYLEGVQVNELGKHAQLSEKERRVASKRILTRLSEAYGRMIIVDGVFQADGHPGNILVMGGGTVGLLDYGQSKTLSDEQRLKFAEMILALNQSKQDKVVAAMSALGIVTAKSQHESQVQHAYNMFDTRGVTMDLFGPNSLLKANPVTEFPQEFFFVLRVVQLLRGLGHGMGVEDFSCASQWKPFAEHAVNHRGRNRRATSDETCFTCEH